MLGFSDFGWVSLAGDLRCTNDDVGINLVGLLLVDSADSFGLAFVSKIESAKRDNSFLLFERVGILGGDPEMGLGKALGELGSHLDDQALGLLVKLVCLQDILDNTIFCECVAVHDARETLEHDGFVV